MHCTYVVNGFLIITLKACSFVRCTAPPGPASTTYLLRSCSAIVVLIWSPIYPKKHGHATARIARRLPWAPQTRSPFPLLPGPRAQHAPILVPQSRQRSPRSGITLPDTTHATGETRVETVTRTRIRVYVEGPPLRMISSISCWILALYRASSRSLAITLP